MAMHDRHTEQLQKDADVQDKINVIQLTDRSMVVDASDRDLRDSKCLLPNIGRTGTSRSGKTDHSPMFKISHLLSSHANLQRLAVL